MDYSTFYNNSPVGKQFSLWFDTECKVNKKRIIHEIEKMDYESIKETCKTTMHVLRFSNLSFFYN